VPVVPGRYNLFNGSRNRRILQQARDNGAGYIAFSPLAQGLLTGRYLDGTVAKGSRMDRNQFLRKEQLTVDLLTKIRRLNEISAKRDQSLAEMSLAWLLKDDLVTSVIIGASSVSNCMKT